MPITNNIWQGDEGSDPTVVGNWSQGTVPATDEYIHVPANNAVAISGGDMSSSVDIGHLNVETGFTPNIGSYVDDGSGYLKFSLNGATDKKAWLGGTGVCYLDLSNAAEIYVAAAGSAPAVGKQALNLVGSSNTLLRVACGAGQSVGLAALAGETAAFATIDVHSGKTFIGPGVTASALNILGGAVECRPNIATVDLFGGTLTAFGQLTTVDVANATLVYASTDTITALTLRSGARLDLSQHQGALTVTTLITYDGYEINDPFQRLHLAVHAWHYGSKLSLNIGSGFRYDYRGIT